MLYYLYEFCVNLSNRRHKQAPKIWKILVNKEKNHIIYAIKLHNLLIFYKKVLTNVLLTNKILLSQEEIPDKGSVEVCIYTKNKMDI